MGNIIIEEDATPKPVLVNLIEEAVVLPGKPLTYDDLTTEQIEELQRPAKEAAETANKAAADANSAAQKAVTAAEIANSAASRANSASQTAISAAGTANTAATLAETAKDEANAAAQNAKDATNEANTAIINIKALGTELENKESEREASETLRKEAETKRAEAETNREQKFSQMETTITGLVEETTKAKDDATKAATSANEAAEKANTATTSANNAAKSANDAASAANQAAQNVDGRVTELEGKASQVYNNLAAIEASGETNPNKIYIDGETMQPYIYKGGKFVSFKGYKDTLSYKYYKLDFSGISNLTKTSVFKHIAYDEDNDVIYLLAVHPVNLLLKVKDMKIVVSKYYSMVYENCDSPIVVIGDKIYATMNGDNGSFIRRINKDTLEQELAIQYEGIINGKEGCGLYKVSENLYLRGIDNKLYSVNKDDLTLEETGIENIQAICNFRLDKIAYTDGVNCYLFDGAITHTKSLPDGFNDVYFIAPYRANNTDSQLLLVIVQSNSVKMFSFGSENTSGTLNIVYIKSKIFPFMRIRNITSVESPCLIEKANMYYCSSYFPSFNYGTPVCYGAPFYVNNAYLYGNKDIYCSNGGLIM